MQNSKKIELLVCDLDNTLYDWVGYFVPSFYAMIEKVIEITGCDKEVLLDDFQKVHQRHHDSEHPFALLETDIVKSIFADCSHDEVLNVLDPAFYAFNSMRKQTLRLHDGVAETLRRLSDRQIQIVAHTEGKLFAVIDRLRRLDIEHFFSSIYCRERPVSRHPDEEAAKIWLEAFPLYKVTELGNHQQKPDPTVLLEICSKESVSPSEVGYVGDSVARDILMANRAGVFSIWAKYGAQHDRDDYARLVRISHWTDEDVEREIRLKEEARGVAPSFIAKNSFREVLKAIDLK